MSATKLNGPILGSVATPSGAGYWMVGSDGGIFSFGDAKFHGSTGNHETQQAGHGHGPGEGRQRLLAGRLRRRHLRLRRAASTGSMGDKTLNKPDQRHGPRHGAAT